MFLFPSLSLKLINPVPCLHVLLLLETPTTQVVAAHEKQPRTIRESVCQQPMEGGSKRAKKLGKRAKKLGKRAKKLGKRRILESECGISAFLLLFSTCNSLEMK